MHTRKRLNTRLFKGYIARLPGLQFCNGLFPVAFNGSKMENDRFLKVGVSYWAHE